MKGEKKTFFIYDFTIDHTNRGCQALTYGSLYFLQKNYNLLNYNIITPAYSFRYRTDEHYKIELDNQKIIVTRRYYQILSLLISIFVYKIFGNLFRFSRLLADLATLEYVSNISGGDGFSDIYRTKTFYILAWPSLLAVYLRKKLIIMPQTIGPFSKKYNRIIAHYILKGAYKVYVRDLMYVDILKSMNIKFELSYDVSYFMKPEKVKYNLPENSVGINISGLTFYNNYRNLKGKFTLYKPLLVKIIKEFHANNIDIVLIPHTYNLHMPEQYSDDLQAAKDILALLDNQKGISIIDLDLTAPELKYIISQFDFFIGTRMHANFAAIYTNVPVFGLAYSYKFKGSFDLYGLPNNYAPVINISEDEIAPIVQSIMAAYANRDSVSIKSLSN